MWQLSKSMDYELLSGVFILIAGIYLLCEGGMRLISKKYFLSSQKKLLKAPWKLDSTFPDDVFLERYLHPAGWVVLGVGSIAAGVSIVFLK